MLCVHPFNLNFHKKYNETGLFKYLMLSHQFPHGLEVPCGKCLPCRNEKSFEWSRRLTDELGYWKKSVFITLTYDEDHLEYNSKGYPTLSKSTLQKFIKRLRRALGYHNIDTKLKYFACGEYGDRTSRPHYHIIIFGLGLWKYDKQLIKDCWTFGSIDFGSVTRASIKYVASYVNKKTGSGFDDTYSMLDIQEPFRLMSHKIGYQYCVDNRQLIEQFNYGAGLPRYYKKVIFGEDSEVLRQHSQQQFAKMIYKQYQIGVFDRDDLIDHYPTVYYDYTAKHHKKCLLRRSELNTKRQLYQRRQV